MARHEALVDICRICRDPRIAGEGGGHPEGLAPHLTAALAELSHGLHGLQGGVDLAARVEIAALRGSKRPDGGRGIARSDGAFELRHEKALELLASSDKALLAIGLEAEGVRIAPRGEGAVGEVQKREESWVTHADGRLAGCDRAHASARRPGGRRWPPSASRPPRVGSGAASSRCHRAPEGRRPLWPRGNAGCRHRRRCEWPRSYLSVSRRARARASPRSRGTSPPRRPRCPPDGGGSPSATQGRPLVRPWWSR